MTGVAALAICAAFTSCSKSGDELYNPDAVTQMNKDKITETYNARFLAYVGGSIAPDQDWGFGSAGTRANTGETVPATEPYHNMNHNEWADPDVEFGGYTVPDPLTDEQKAVVAAYFQSVPDLTYSDPGWRHFFIQQVYKGGKTTVRNTTEGITAANNTKYDSNNMNKLSVGQDNIHINNFNAGSCSSSNVLDNGQHVGGSEHSDEITLMVNIDDTSCFGYHETGSSTQHNDKAALVGWETIRDWANDHGLNGNCLDDKWNRSFLGFDLAIKEGAQAQSDVAAKYNDGPDGNYSYAKINGEIVSVDGNTSMNIYYLDTNTNMYVAADKKNIGDGDFVTEYRVNGEYKGKYINVDYLMSLINDGWLPVKDKNLREWVKVGKSDGYFSDWIVTLTKAEKITPPTPPTRNYTIRVLGEDLTFANTTSASGVDVTESDEGADFDFNDVVFDVAHVTGGTADENGTWIRLMAAGGTLPLYIGSEAEANEVHNMFKVSKTTMVNTGHNAHKAKDPVEFRYSADQVNAKDIAIIVIKDGLRFELSAQRGEPASKMAVSNMNFDWADER